MGEQFRKTMVHTEKNELNKSILPTYQNKCSSVHINLWLNKLLLPGKTVTEYQHIRT